MDDLELHQHVQNIWAAQKFLLDLQNDLDNGLSMKALEELNTVINKVSDAGSAAGDFEGRLS